MEASVAALITAAPFTLLPDTSYELMKRTWRLAIAKRAGGCWQGAREACPWQVHSEATRTSCSRVQHHKEPFPEFQSAPPCA